MRRAGRAALVRAALVRAMGRPARLLYRCGSCGRRGHIRCYTFVFDPPIVLRGRRRGD